jgi:hypothetical protein
MANIPYLRSRNSDCYHDAGFLQEFAKEEHIEPGLPMDESTFLVIVGGHILG